MSENDDPITVVVADDHPAVRSGLVGLLDADPGIDVVGEAVDGPTALREVERLRPTVVLTDVRMPGATGIEITPRLRATGARVLVISAFDLDTYVLGALAAGADGYVVKTEEPDRILQAVRRVAAGDAVLSASTTRAVVDALRRRHPTAADGSGDASVSVGAGEAVAPYDAGRPYDTGRSGDAAAFTPDLTEREGDVLRLLARGMSNQQIARELVVEVTTVKTHITHVLAKLQVDSRVQAALWWHRHGDEDTGTG